MKIQLSFLSFFGLSTLTFAALSSPIPSSVEGISIPNTHYVSKEDTRPLLRGMAPHGELKSLLKMGITDFLIFKLETRNEVTQEVTDLIQLGVSPSRIHKIPFQWKKVEFTESCLQTIEALSLMRKIAKSKDRALFFHCTVGEDRTGVLSGLYQMLRYDTLVWDAFENEMCEKGYGSGNPHKPYFKVVKPIRENLTPFYLKMAFLITYGKFNSGPLDPQLCQKDPETDSDYRENFLPYLDEYKCNSSSLVPSQD